MKLRFASFLQPKATLSQKEINTGLRVMVWEGVTSIGFTSITTSGFLAAFALVLGANNLQIGVLAALPFITQPLQIPAIWLVERTRRRKAINLPTWITAQLLWFPIALIPFLVKVPGASAISLLLTLMAARGILVAVVNCSWNSWIRDLVPQQILGSFFSRRLAFAGISAGLFGLGAAFFVDFWRGQFGVEQAAYGYSYIMLFGAVFLGLASPLLMALIPEPLMPASIEPKLSLLDIITPPLRDVNYRQLMRFLLLWSLALNLAVPFFAVYMLQRVGLSLTAVTALVVLSQITNILFLRVWGPLADKFSNKAVLSICASLYLLVILGWTFTTMPERHFLTVPLLIVLHIFAGIATAGVTITVGTIGMKLAPQGHSTSYLAGASLATNIGAGLGPIIGGSLAHFFSQRSLSLDFTWTSPDQAIRLGIVHLTGFDFLFLITFIVGLITLNLLVTVREQGEVDRDAILKELIPRRHTMPGLGFVSTFPFNYLKKIPGMDVAIGVTAYQIADAAKMIAHGLAQGRRMTSEIAKNLEHGFSQLWEEKDNVPEHATSLAEHATRGTVHVGANDARKTEHVLRPAVAGILKTLSEAQSDPEDAVRGIGRGAVNGAIEAGIDIDKVVVETIAGVREAAGSLNLDKERLTTLLINEMLRVGISIGGNTKEIIGKAIRDEVERTSEDLS